MLPLPPLPGGSNLPLTAQPSDAFYVLRHGALKLVARPADGSEHTVGFRLQDAVLSAPAAYVLPWEAAFIALAECRICRLRARLFHMAMRQRLGGLHSAWLREEFDFQLSLLPASAEQRIAAFVLRVSDRLKAPAFRLPMALGDIADYLDVGPSRVRAALARFISYGWLEMAQGNCRIRNVAALRRVLNP